jgi:uncharacterized membrane protein YgcG
MPDNSKSRPSAAKSPISRRGFLEKSLVGAALAGTTVLPAWMPVSPLTTGDEVLHEAQGKASKASVAYRDRPNGSQQCSGCTHFRNGQCEIVEGQISPNGWCRRFKSKSGGGGGGGRSSGGSGRSSGGGGGGGGGSGY